MKKFLLALIVLFIFLLIGGVIFLATLDVDKYRPQIIAQVENALGKPVKLEKISLGWHSGLALELKGLAILKGLEASPETQKSQEWITLKSAKAVLNLSPLMARQIQITTLYLNHPVVRLRKFTDGAIEGLESKPKSVKPGASGPAKQETSSEAAAALSFLIDEIRIEDGEFFLKDESGRETVEISAGDIDIVLKNVAFNEPIDMQAKAAVLSKDQNINITGKLKISPQDATNTLSRIHAELDLASIDFEQLARLNASAASAIQPPLAGLLTVDIESLKLDAAGLKSVAASTRLTGGAIRLPDLKTPVESITLEALATSDNIKIERLSADFGGGKIQGQGNVNIRVPANPVFNFEMRADNLSLANFAAETKPDAPQLEGVLSASFQGSAAGQDSRQIMQSLNGQGVITIDQAVLRNLNVLREVFQKLSMIPGLMKSLSSRLPEGYQEKLDAKDTHFENIKIPLTAQNGVVEFKQVNIISESFAVKGSGVYQLLPQTVSGQAALAIEPDLTNALVRSVQELQSLTNQQGQLQIPLFIQGRVPKISVSPDLQYIASRLAVQTLGGLLGNKQGTGENGTQTGNNSLLGLLQGQNTQQPTASGTGGQPQQTQKAPKASQIFGQLLESALAGQQGSDSDSQQQQQY